MFFDGPTEPATGWFLLFPVAALAGPAVVVGDLALRASAQRGGSGPPCRNKSSKARGELGGVWVYDAPGLEPGCTPLNGARRKR